MSNTPPPPKLVTNTNELSIEDLTKFVNKVKQQSLTTLALGKIITTDGRLHRVKNKIIKLAPTNIPVLIVGETGTGKELFARALHGERRGNFLAVNASGIPDTLLESSFFGAEKGAYTGCDRTRQGYIEAAEGGTLFLDEIGDMPLMLQVKLLRFLQDGTYIKVGGVTEIKSNVRVVSATNVTNLSRIKGFRKDLYYRIAGVKFTLPPLRERPEEDIDELVRNYESGVFKERADLLNVIAYLKDNIFPVRDNGKEAFMNEEFSLGNVRSVMNFLRVRKLDACEEPIE